MNEIKVSTNLRTRIFGQEISFTQATAYGGTSWAGGYWTPAKGFELTSGSTLDEVLARVVADLAFRNQAVIAPF